MIPKDISTKIGKAVSDKMKALSQLEAFEEARKKEQEAAPVAPAVPEKAVAEVEDTLVEDTPVRVPAYIQKHLTTPEPVMSDEDRMLEKFAAAGRAKRYQAALPSGGASKEALVEMRKTGEVADFEQPEKGFAERYDEDVRFQEEEYGEGSLERNRLLAEIAGYDYVDKKGRKQRARGEDDKLYSQKYSEAKEENPDATEEELQDAALKAVMAYRAREAELDIDKILRESEVEATEDVGADLEREKTLAQREAEEAERLKKEEEKKKPLLSEDAQKRTLGGPGTSRERTPQQEAARKALDTRESPDSFDVEYGESPDSFEDVSEFTEGEVEKAAAQREREATPSEPTAARVASGTQEEREEYARYKPEVKKEVERRILEPATAALDKIYLSADDQELTAKNLDQFLTKTRAGYSVLGGLGQSALDTLTARNDYQYYKTLPVFMKRNLDREALKAIEFFDVFNRDRGEPTLSQATELLGSPSQKAQSQGKFLRRIERAKRALEDRLRRDAYEQSDVLPGRFMSGEYLPWPGVPAFFGASFQRDTPVRTEEIPLEAQEDIYQESPVEDLIASLPEVE